MRAIESVDSLNSSVSFSNNNIDIRLQETEVVFSGHSLAVSWCLVSWLSCVRKLIFSVSRPRTRQSLTLNTID